MSRFCTKCGAKLDDSCSFCVKCGAALPKSGADNVTAPKKASVQQKNNVSVNASSSNKQNNIKQDIRISRPSNNRNKILGIVACVVVALGIGFGAFYGSSFWGDPYEGKWISVIGDKDKENIVLEIKKNDNEYSLKSTVYSYKFSKTGIIDLKRGEELIDLEYKEKNVSSTKKGYPYVLFKRLKAIAQVDNNEDSAQIDKNQGSLKGYNKYSLVYNRLKRTLEDQDSGRIFAKYSEAKLDDNRKLFRKSVLNSMGIGKKQQVLHNPGVAFYSVDAEVEFTELDNKTEVVRPDLNLGMKLQSVPKFYEHIKNYRAFFKVNLDALGPADTFYMKSDINNLCTFGMPKAGHNVYKIMIFGEEPFDLKNMHAFLPVGSRLVKYSNILQANFKRKGKRDTIRLEFSAYDCDNLKNISFHNNNDNKKSVVKSIAPKIFVEQRCIEKKPGVNYITEIYLSDSSSDVKGLVEIINEIEKQGVLKENPIAEYLNKID